MSELDRTLESAAGYLALGMLQDAWDELECLPPDLRVDDAVMALRIKIYQGLEKWESARVLAESLAKRSPGNPGWWIAWAYSLRREKSLTEALGVLMEAASHHPDDALIPYNQACCCSVEGDLESASAFLRQAFTMNPGLKITAIDEPDLEPIWVQPP